MNVGYSVSKLKAMIESSNKGNVAYPLVNYHDNKLMKMSDITQLNYGARMVVFQNKIHVIGGSGYATRHEVWDGEKWTLLGQIPMYCENSGVVVYKDAIHVLGSDSSTYKLYHYKYDGTAWTRLDDYTGALMNYGCTTDGKYIYCGSSAYLIRYSESVGLQTLSTLPTNFGSKSLSIIYDEKDNFIRLFNGNKYTFYNLSDHTWSADGVVEAFESSTDNSNISGLCYFNDDIYCTASPNYSSTNVDNKLIYKFNRSSHKWECIYKGDEFIPKIPSMCVYNNAMYLLTGNNSKNFYKYDFSKGIQGYVEKDTKIYYPVSSIALKGDLVTVDGGYIAKSSGEIKIADK